jgi:hypothetical protein
MLREEVCTKSFGGNLIYVHIGCLYSVYARNIISFSHLKKLVGLCEINYRFYLALRTS